MSELGLLRIVELKGRVRADDVATPLGIGTEEAGELLAGLMEHGLVAPAGAAYRLSEAGRSRLEVLLAEDRAPVDQVLLGLAYDEFCGFNAELKAIITAWQLKDASTPNDHTDAEYDAGVLAALHAQVLPLVERLGLIAPRLMGYAARLQHACDQVASGQTTWVARPILDSYHTVWFELHEDLIQLSGRTRLEEAVAGRAH
jgi:pyruvate,orthophosphate dikinase